VPAIIRSNLNRTGQFRAMPTANIREIPARGAEINMAYWRSAKQDFLVIGRVLDDPAGGFRVEFELHDVVNQRKMRELSYPIRASEFRSVSHRISDEIYEAILGVRGAFFTKIAYIKAQRLAPNKYEYGIWVADSDGYAPQRIVRNTEPFLSPAWSPDGRYLAYVSFEREGPQSLILRQHVYIHELATGQRRMVTNFKGINGAPNFSPDGRTLLITLSRSGNPEINKVDLASNAITQLTRHFGIDTEAFWMPGGNSFLFTSDRSGKPQIYALSADGGTPERVTFEGEYNAKVNVSYDGKKWAMVQGRGNVYRIAVLDRERGNPGTVRLISPGPMDESPSFAPNASMVLYAAREGSRGVLYAAAADGSVRQRLALPDGDIREPAWGPFRQR
jgi:TolB protein